MDSKNIFTRSVRGSVLIFLVLLVAMTMAWPTLGWTRGSGEGESNAQSSEVALVDSQSATLLTGYYNLLGYEGIGTLGTYGGVNYGPTPPIGDYVSTHCRYINVANTHIGEYYLRYPLHLPDGATITKVSLYVADFAGASGYWWAYLRYRNWNSRDAGTTLGFASCCTTDNDHTMNLSLTGGANLKVNNQTKEYWIDTTPIGAAIPGQLCVYGIQVTYTYDGVLMPLIRKGG